MVAVPTRQEATLTGRARMRPAFFGRMQLQVQERVDFYGICPPPPGRTNDADWREFCHRGTQIRWRDATWLDMQEVPTFTLGVDSDPSPQRRSE